MTAPPRQSDETAPPARTGDPEGAMTVLQAMIWPEQGICTERDLYVRTTPGTGLSETAQALHFTPGSGANFNTYFNLFNIGKWRRQCDLRDIHLSLTGTGRFEVSVFLAMDSRSWERLVCDIVDLRDAAPVRFDLSHCTAFDHDGVLFFELTALSPGTFEQAVWHTAQAPVRTPDLALSITTFRREAAVALTVARFEAFIAKSDLADHIRLLVVDNGQSAGLTDSAHMRAIANENLGGAGGFTRGLIAARDLGCSHCLFMDDDAAIHMASLERTWQMLAYARDPATAIAGAMINGAHRWALWENGAVFNTRCIPRHMGTDLRNPDEVLEMEFDTTKPAPANLYGGWWYFAFPLDHVSHLPFPFFVRGDDVSFSLAHDFNILTLPGVVSFQDSFTDKESPLTWYLDLRSHLVHHLSLPSMDIGAARTLKIAIWFFARNLLRMHYDTLSAINLALEDVLQGPEFFADNADMAQRRADIKALTRTEAWQPVDTSLPADTKRFNPKNPVTRMAMRLLANGYLLPGFARWGNRITLPLYDRGAIRPIWGAAQITYLDGTGRNAYTVRHSKAQAWRQVRRLLRNAWIFRRRYDGLKAAYQAAYPHLTSQAFWADKLALGGSDPAPSPPAGSDRAGPNATGSDTAPPQPATATTSA